MPTLFELPKMPGNANKWLRVNPTETGYVWDVAPPPGSGYDTIENNLVPQIQRSILNFSSLFVASDNVGNLSTDIDIDVTNLAGDTTFTTVLAGDNNFTTILAGDTNFTTILAGDTNFNDTLVSNNYFTTNLAGDTNFTTVLAGDTNFINTLTSNSTFITNVGSVGTSISVNDTTPSYLGNKIVAGQNITFTIENPGGNEDILIDAGPLLQTDGVDNGDQTLLNLVAGTNVVLTDDGMGSVTIDATGGGGGSTPFSINQTGHGFAVGDIITPDINQWKQSLADAPANAEAWAQVTVVTDADNFTALPLVGTRQQDAGILALIAGFAGGDPIYLDAVTPGTITNVAPSGGTTVTKPVGYVEADSGGTPISLLTVNYRGQNNQTVPLLPATTISSAIPATRVSTAASGAVTYPHGLGVTPSIVRIRGGTVLTGTDMRGYSDGIYNDSGNNCFSWDTASITLTPHSGQIIHFEDVNGGNSQTAVCTVDATNVTLTWTKTGTGGQAGTSNFLIEAEANIGTLSSNQYTVNANEMDATWFTMPLTLPSTNGVNGWTLSNAATQTGTTAVAVGGSTSSTKIMGVSDTGGNREYRWANPTDLRIKWGLQATPGNNIGFGFVGTPANLPNSNFGVTFCNGARFIWKNATSEWYAAVDDGTSNTEVLIATPNNHLHIFEIVYTSTVSFEFFVDGVSVATIGIAPTTGTPEVGFGVTTNQEIIVGGITISQKII